MICKLRTYVGGSFVLFVGVPVLRVWLLTLCNLPGLSRYRCPDLSVVGDSPFVGS
jgi:hypothetical protein